MKKLILKNHSNQDEFIRHFEMELINSNIKEGESFTIEINDDEDLGDSSGYAKIFKGK